MIGGRSSSGVINDCRNDREVEEAVLIVVEMIV